MSITLYPNLILDALRKVRYPGTGQDLVTAGMVEDDIRIEGMKVSFSLIFDKPNSYLCQPRGRDRGEYPSEAPRGRTAGEPSALAAGEEHLGDLLRQRRGREEYRLRQPRCGLGTRRL